MQLEPEIAISSKALRKEFDKVIAVRDLNLKIPKGECYGLIGPNGAGKTTTIRMLVGLLEPTLGIPYVGGYDMGRQAKEAYRLIGYMPDFFPVYRALKVWEYLDYFAASYQIPISRRRKAIKESLELVELGGKWEAYCRELSRGMRQRLVLAKTLVHNPEILLLDEPASGLDPMGRIQFREIMKELTGLGKTILISSHILTELSDFCTSIGIMEKGHLIVSGTIEEIRRRTKPHRHLLIGSLKPPGDLAEFLKCEPNLANLRVKEGCVEADFSGSRQELAELNYRLNRSGLGIYRFYEEEEDLEDLFIKISSHEVT